MDAAGTGGRRPRMAFADGQALVIFALFALVLVGALALSIDAGYLMAQRRGAQSAADSAALAADKAVQRNQLANVAATGQGYAASNGYSTGAGATVSINHPPQTGSHAGDAGCVEAVVSKPVQKFFVGAVYSGAWQVSARGVACDEPTTRPYALLALQPGGTGITSGGSSFLQINNGGAISDNNVDICGTASWIQADGPLDAVNGIVVCPNATADAQTMNGNSPTAPDPLASTAAPSAAQCGATQPDPNIKNSSPTTVTLSPGNYTNGITISGNDRTIIFQTGVYCFGGDLKTNGGSSGNVLKGTNVLFYFKNGSVFNVDGGGNDVQLTSGPGGSCSADACNAHVVIYYGAANCGDLWLVGGNHTNLDGIVYAPCSLVHLGGGSGSQITGQVLAGSVVIKGGANLTINYKNYVDTKIPLVYLVE